MYAYTVNCWGFMPRRYEIDAAFKQAIKISEKGRRTVTTKDFVAELAKRNWPWGCVKRITGSTSTSIRFKTCRL